MGCCHSREQRHDAPRDVTEHPSVVHVDSVVSTKASSVSALEAYVTTAGWAADTNFGRHVKMVEIRDRVFFACLFDPHSTNDAAAFCLEKCQDVFVTCMKKCNGRPEQALEQTLENLDQQFLKSSLSAPVRALSGCSAVLVYIDLDGQKCWMANTGTSECIIGIAEGAFNSKFMDGRSISCRHDSQNPVEQDYLRARFPQDSETILKTTDCKTLLKGITKITRCIGYGFAKDPKLAAIYNKNTARPLFPLPTVQNSYILSKPHIEECDLTRGVEKIILCSEGMVQLMSPAEMAVFTMHFENSSFAQLAEMHRRDPSLMQNSPSLTSPSAALVCHAVSKAAERFANVVNTFQKSFRTFTSAKTKDLELVSTEDMRQLKVKRLPTVQNPNVCPSSSFCRKDVHENLSCVVISLNSHERSRRLLPQPSRSRSISPEVLYRWKLIQLYCKFHIQRRRACLRRWWQLIALAVTDAQQRILDNEKADWLREVNGIAHISIEEASDGGDSDKLTSMTNQASVFPSKLGSGIRKWMDATSRKGMAASMTEADFSAKAICL